MSKDEIAQRLREIAIYLELDDASPFEVLAFRNAAESLHDWDGDLGQAVSAGTLTEIHAVGKGIAGVIAEFAREGRAQKHAALRDSYPPRILELFEVPGLGMKKVRMLHAELGIDSLQALERAAAGGAIRGLRGFGAKSEERILRGIEWARRHRDDRLNPTDR